MNEKILKHVLENPHSFTMELNTVQANDETRTIPMTFFKPYIVTKWWGNIKILTGKKNWQLDRWTQKQGAPFLKDHNPEDQRGIILNGYFRDETLGGDVKFSRTPDGENLYLDTKDGIRPYTSMGFEILKVREMTADEMNDEEKKIAIDTQMPIYVVELANPIEGSSVYSGAIPLVGTFGYDFFDMRRKDEIRKLLNEFELPAKYTDQFNQSGIKIKLLTNKNGDNKMTEEEKKAADLKLKEDQNLAEEKRVADIDAFANQWKEKVKGVDLLKVAEEYKALKQPATKFGDFITELVAKQHLEAAQKPTVDMSEKDLKIYSLSRAVRSAVSGVNCFEKEISDEFAKKTGQAAEGLYLPYNAILPYMRVSKDRKRVGFDLTAGTSTSASELVGTDHLGAMFIDYLYDKMVLDNVTLMPGRKGNIEIPVLSASAGHGWAATETTAVAEGAPTTTSKTASPKRGGRYVDITKMLMVQSDPPSESLFVNDLVKSLALGLQNAILNGSGSSGQPTGVKNTTGIGDAGDLASMNYEKAVDFETLIDDALGDDNGMYYVTRRAHRGKLKSRPKISGAAQGFICENNEVNGYQMRTTNLVTSGEIFFGDWTQVLVPMWDGVDLVYDPFTNAPSGLVRITANQMLDIIVRYASAFSHGINFD